MDNNIKVKVDTKKFKKGYQQYLNSIQSQKMEILSKGAGIYAQWASLYVPPKPFGQKEIKENLYKRKLLFLPKEVKRPRNKYTGQDKLALANGNLWKIYKKLPGSKKFEILYFKKITGKVKKLLTIANRGLLRASFGAGITAIGEKIPTNIRRLLMKSKNLRKLIHFNQYQFNETNSKTSLKIINNSSDAKNAAFEKIAVREGDKHAEQYIIRRAKDILKQAAKI